MNETTVSFSGMDMGGLGKIIAENNKIIVVKFPSGKHFAGRGCQRYHSPSIRVLQKQADGWAYELINWDVTKPVKKV